MLVKDDDVMVPIDLSLFRAVASNWASGVAVVTTIDGHGKPFGVTMTSVTSLSLSPPQFLICLDKNANCLRPLLESRMFCINYLSTDQQAISATFARKSEQKFADVLYTSLQSGLPAIEGAIAHIECVVVEYHAGGDHVIVIGDVAGMQHHGGSPLVYFQGRYRQLQ